MLKHSDLKSKGLILTQLEAQEIHSKINGISQGHFPDGIVYPGSEQSEEKKGDPLKEYYAELRGKNAELLKENAALKSAAAAALQSQKQSNENGDTNVDKPVKELKKPVVKTAKKAEKVK